MGASYSVLLGFRKKTRQEEMIKLIPVSTDTERVEDGTETSVESFDWYHLPVIGVVMLFMVANPVVRSVRHRGRNARPGEVDSWYHWRTINWTAENYPHTMPYEVWTGFPTGNYVGQFGTLFDQLIVTVAMIVGLGDPSQQTLYTVSLLSIPVMAALVAIPVFYAGRRLGGTLGGVVSVLVLALAKGQFLSRSTVGQLDHHVGEVLFMAIAILAMMVALTVAEREKPIYELVVDRGLGRAPTARHLQRTRRTRAHALYLGLAVRNPPDRYLRHLLHRPALPRLPPRCLAGSRRLRGCSKPRRDRPIDDTAHGTARQYRLDQFRVAPAADRLPRGRRLCLHGLARTRME